MASLKQPLLNDDHSSSSSKVKGCDTITPYANASLFRTLTFSWITPLLALGHEKTLDVDDIPQVNPVNSVFEAYPIFQNKLGLYHVVSSRVNTFSLARALLLSAWKEILWTAIVAVIYSVARYVTPYLLDSFVECLNGGGNFKNQGYILAVIFCTATLFESLTRRHWIFKLQQVGLRFRGTISTMIYSKGIKLSHLSKQGQGSGEMINFLAVDVEKVYNFTTYLHDTWLIVLQVIFGLLILYKNLGVASFAALGAIVIVMLSNSAIGLLEENSQSSLMKAKDKRMKMTSETLGIVRLLKLQGWEMNFLSKILELRRVETVWLRKYLFNKALMSFVFNIATTFVALVTFGSCVLLGIPLETGKILSALATFRVLQEPMYSLPDTISMLIQLKVSLGRIASFLCQDELQVDSVEKLPLGSSESDTAIEIIDGNFIWDKGLPVPTLKNLNLKVSSGTRIGICGTVGSGKSSLLTCILGEMPKISGTVKLWGTKAYVAQTPWIHSGTIQENILLGKELNLDRYNKVLEACSLKKDLEILSFGDQTVIGEKGINLSGGQKQRIQIARAVYHDADIYLFDDPFSAVDAHTGYHLFKEVLLGLLRGKTVVYVTHQVEFLNGADRILVMKDGRITQAGKYDEILTSGSDFKELLDSDNAALSALNTSISIVGKASFVDETHPKTGDSDSTNEATQQEGSKHVQNGETDGKTSSLPPAQIIQKEERETGSVGFPIYWKYLTTAYGGSLAILILLCLILAQILGIVSNYWLAWASPISKDAKPAVSGSTLMIVYASLAIGISFSTLLVDLFVAIIGFTTATKLFKKMHQCLFRAPMSFFDATPSGRIHNRCSADQSSVENQIPVLLHGVAEVTFNICGIIAVIATVAWQVLFIFIPVILGSIWCQRFYIPSARELTRLSGVCKAPIIQNFSETLSGTTTIRGFDLQSAFQVAYMKVLDTYARPVFYSAAVMKWLLLRLDAFSSVTFAFLLFLLVSFSEHINPAIAGLAVTYGLTVNTQIAGFVWHICHCETKMIAVERILQYMSIPSEAPLVIETNRPEQSWPSHGEICITNLQVRYAPQMPLVLHGISCTFPGKMKTGIVGRTGSGKSTLIQALFRIVEPTNGHIRIDGIDISMIGLQDLRSKLGIIPQDPIMFQGTIRSNLDPLEQFTDLQIWETLDKCQLGDEVRKMEKKLDSDVTENGENWSMGQRQLVCLGRVLLKKSKVLVLDEATASVDTATDNLIQQTLKEHFSSCTIITIAHRMTSVLDSDMLLLLNNGLIEEFNSTTKLLENKSSSFAQLVAAWSRSHSKDTSD